MLDVKRGIGKCVIRVQYMEVIMSEVKRQAKVLKKVLGEFETVCLWC